VSLLVVGLHFLPSISQIHFADGMFLVSTVSALMAGVTAAAAALLYVFVPKKGLWFASFILYALLVATTANLVLSTGETSSPFIALWIAVALFSGIFGLGGLLFMVVLGSSYVVYLFVGGPTVQSILIAGLAMFAPLIASFIIWHSKSAKDELRDRAYQELATELSHESNKADVVINAIEDGVVAIDKQGIIQLINPAAQHIIGWSSGDAIGLTYKSVIKLNDRQDKPVSVSNDPIEKVLADGKEVETEDFSTQTESGKKVLLSLIISPIGQPSSGAIIVFRDITKSKAAEREQAEFISTASHEMRTPVASIEGYLGLAMNPNTATVDARAQDYITKAHESAQHLGRLFQDLLDVSKAEDGRIGNNPSVVDVVEFVGDIAGGLEPKAREKGLQFLYKPASSSQSANDRFMAPVYYANVDNDHLREVVSNLIENAIKYTPQGDVTVDITADDEHITISIADSGIGIPAEDIPHLFQKFYRVDNTDTREIGGTGLGLYLCRRLAEVMNGAIRVSSEYKRGSTFYLDIPRIEHEEAARLIETSTELAAAQTEAPTILPQPQAAMLETPQPTVAATPAYTPPIPVSTPVMAPTTPPIATPVPPSVPVRSTIQVPVRGPGETS